jgi:hypothetical protein
VTVLHVLSTAVLACIAIGVRNRRDPRLHVRWMTAAFCLDLALVVYIEGTRHAIEKAVAPAASIVWIHAGLSTLALVGYVAQIVVGRRILAGGRASRRTHITLGLAFCLVRAMSYATSFTVVQPRVPAAALVETRVEPAVKESLQSFTGGMDHGQVVIGR